MAGAELWECWRAGCSSFLKLISRCCLKNIDETGFRGVGIRFGNLDSLFNLRVERNSMKKSRVRRSKLKIGRTTMKGKKENWNVRKKKLERHRSMEKCLR